MPSDRAGIRKGLRLPRTRLAAASCLALALAFGPAACGSDNSDSSGFSTDYNAAIAKLDRASQELATTQTTTKSRSSRAIARQLDRFADLLADTGKDLARLDAPKSATDQFSALTGALDKSIASARRAARAAREIQPARQRKALRQLRDDVVEVARAQDALQRAIESS
jgi:acyl-CoA reductase-like NAD-dependent aldehyde dehydrogenase